MRLLTVTLLAISALTAGEFPIGSKLDSLQPGGATPINFAGSKGTAVLLVSTQCPVSNAYNDRMTELYKDYSSKGLQFVFVNSNATEDQAAIDAHTTSSGFPFKVHRDVDNVLADKLNAQYTPELFVFDSKGTLVYHGRIDDSRELPRVTKKDARAAFDAILAGQAVPVAETKAFGCTIKRAKKTS